MRIKVLFFTLLTVPLVFTFTTQAQESRGGSGGGFSLMDSLQQGNNCSVTSKDSSCHSPINSCEFVNSLVAEVGKNRGKESAGYCARGVRSAFQETCSGSVGMPWCSGAKDMGGCLAKLGMKMDEEALKSAQGNSSYKFKKGAILIYKSKTDPSHPGHVEVYTGQDYCSDYCDTLRRDVKAPDDRELIGVYYPAGDQDCGS